MRSTTLKTAIHSLLLTGLFGLSAQAQPSVVFTDPLGNPNGLTVVYSTAMDSSSATLLGNYRLTNAAGTLVPISGAVLGGDQVTVQLQLGASLQLTTNYTLVVSNVKDAGLSTISPNPTLVIFWYGGNPSGPTFSFDDAHVPPGTRLAVGPDTAGNQVNPAQGVTNAGGFGNSGCLILCNPAGGQTFAQWRLTNDYSGGVTVTNLNIAFKLFMGNGSGGSNPPGLPNGGGNGMLFHWGPGLLEQYSGGASSYGSGLDVTFRSYNSGVNAYGINVYYGGTAGAGNNTPLINVPYMGYFNTNGSLGDFSEAVDVNLSISNGLLSLTVTPTNGVATNIFSNYAIPGFSAPAMGGNNVAFTTTDGSGAHESVWLDNVDLYVNGAHVAAGGQAVGPVGIVVQPASVTTNQNVYVAFNVGVTGAPPVTFQWYSNNVAIPGAVSASYRTPLTLYSTMNETHYSVSVSNSFSYAISSDAVLALLEDTKGTQVASVGSVNGSSIGILFTDFVDPETAGNPANYSVNGGAVAVTAATVRTNIANYGEPTVNYAPSYLRTVRLSLGSAVGNGFTVKVKSGVLSRTGVPLVETNLAGAVVGMTDVDLGNPGVNPVAAGEAFSAGSNQVEVVAGGSDIMPITTAGATDYGNFASLQRTGNFDVAARLTFETLTANGAKAGLMVRPSTTDASSPALSETVFPAAPGRATYETAIRVNPSEGCASWSAIGGNGNLAAYWALGGNWLRIRRLGPTFAGYASSDGLNWQMIGLATPDTNSFPPLEYVGLVATAANNDGRLCEADFQNWGSYAFPTAVVSITSDLKATYQNSENGRQTFTVGAAVSGAPADELVYQWQRQEASGGPFSDLLVGGNTNTYTTPYLLMANDNGAKYRVIAFVGDLTTGHSVTSTVATLTVNVDNTPPYMTSASADATFQQISITFDAPVDGNSIYTATYTVTPVAGGAAVGTSSVNPIVNPDTFETVGVTLALATPLSPGVKYNLSVSGVRDGAGNLIEATTQPGGKTRIVTGWALAYGFLKYERWTGASYPAGAGPYYSTVETLLSNPGFPNSPSTTQLITYSGYANGDASNPSVNTFDFSAKISGFFVPPVTADYSWYVRGNDGTALWVSSSSTPLVPGTDLHKAAANTSFSSPGPSWAGSQTNVGIISVNGNYPNTDPIHMVAGEPYALTALEQQGNGTSFIEFTCGTNGTTVQGGDSIASTPGSAYGPPTTNGRGGASTNTYNLKGTNIAVYVNPDVSMITANGPTNIVVEDKKVGSFAVSASAVVSAGGPAVPVGPVLYQWYSNNVAIAGATGASYTTLQVIHPSPVATYSVVMSVAGMPFMTITNNATLTVIADEARPYVVAASSFGGNTLCLRFDGALNAASVASGTYTISGATVTTARLAGDGITVILTLDQKLSGSGFSVAVSGVQDLAGNVILPGTLVTGSLLATQLAGAVDIGVGTENLGPYVVKTNSQPALTNVTFDVNFPGSTVMVTNGVFEVSASGLDIGNKQDGQQFIYEQRSGDFDISVRVDGLSAANNGTKAGLMVRENLTPGSRRYNIVADPPNTATAADGSGVGLNKVEVTMRTVADDVSATWGNSPAPANLGTGSSATQVPGLWLRLKLVGRTLYAYTGADGTNWALVGRENLASNWPLGNFYVGMCVSSRSSSLYAAARLSNYGDYLPATSKRALFLIGDEMNVPAGAPNATPSNTGAVLPQQASDTRVWNTLIAMGYNVTATRNETFRQEDAEGMSIVVWSSTGNSGGTGNPSALTGMAVPILVWESSAFGKLKMASADGDTVGSKTVINVTNVAAPTASSLSAGLGSGPKTVTSSQTYSRSLKANLGAGAVIVAEQDTDATRAVFWAYEKGAAMTGTYVAPHRRVGFFLNDNGAAALTATGFTLFTNAIEWTAAPVTEAPTIFSAPASQTVAAGTPVTFLVTALGPGPYTYQWSKVTGSATNDILGATSRDYTILAAPLVDDGTGYFVKVTGINSGLSVTSTLATLTVLAPVAITAQPKDVQVSLGQTATFSVSASGSAPAYQWWVIVPAVSTNAIAGANAETYTTPAVTDADNGKLFYVVVTNLISSASSTAATLTLGMRPVFSAPIVVNGQLILDWTGGGTLQASPDLTGEWTNVVGVTSPYTNTVNPEIPALFYRIKLP